MLTSSNIFFELESSTLVSDLYGLMRRIAYIICVAPFCKFTVTLVKHCVITKGAVYGVSYLYGVCLVSMTFILLYSLGQIYVYFRGCSLYSFASTFSDILIPNPPYVLSGESWHGQISIGPDYNLLACFFVEKITNAAASKMPVQGSFLST